ncbi:hypothetical protein [Hydrogenophaga sp. 2FB]|uniref:hypothetical protein n=1 Tax=Hydrogenophaga sp. 2FB TaxID=2502187 RepID=UPI0010F920FD|nr:hypothetical protein [Hydrogenophaga sp. 2FB]
MSKIATTLTLNNGVAAGYKPNEPLQAGVREAIVVCISVEHAAKYPFGIVRADIEGAAWAACHRANAVPVLQAALSSAGAEVMAGAQPKVFLDVSSGGMSNARLVFSDADAAIEAEKPNARSLEVPPNLPYQLGGNESGGFVLLFRPENERGIKVHSVHPTQAEATQAEISLNARAEVKTAVMALHTPVTKIIADVFAGKVYKTALDAESELELASAHGLSADRSTRTLLGTPSPFTGV